MINMLQRDCRACLCVAPVCVRTRTGRRRQVALLIAMTWKAFFKVLRMDSGYILKITREKLPCQKKFAFVFLSLYLDQY